MYSTISYSQSLSNFIKQKVGDVIKRELGKSYGGNIILTESREVDNLTGKYTLVYGTYVFNNRLLITTITQEQIFFAKFKKVLDEIEVIQVCYKVPAFEDYQCH